MAVARPRGPIVSLSPALLPSGSTPLSGRTVHLEKLESKHASDLFHLVGGSHPAHASLWDYMGDGPYSEPGAFDTNIAARSASRDPFFFAVIDRRRSLPSFGQAIGYLSLMRITPDHLTVEIGNVMFSSALQRTTGATEAIYLLARHAFHDLNYRRVEWKCDSLNEPSRRAALRLGFRYEGTFRQHMVVKGRSRDTAWFSLLRDEWDAGVRPAMEQWLHEANFHVDGGQKETLQDLRAQRSWGP
ncbi:acetyltransferase, GNAT family [Aspergillus heteromorphus CBS 117.55]|uniref:Acetyltransferase, GNAT family n=1 Tax=Aspergillus heteromorphus CBS 117.55 TaxID=1448321 RepID=A0A317V440_9EURO|nr:acetyltransferase, GNAT family [Aspergillus heteromorphus CBS 117.55]PWY69044.1 acetyltransferase, GNAT family [Aspergillus heteromorphus CBS 117.55]